MYLKYGNMCSHTNIKKNTDIILYFIQLSTSS